MRLFNNTIISGLKNIPSRLMIRSTHRAYAMAAIIT